MKPGSAVVACVEGSRPLLVEIQALVSRTHFGAPRRLATGVDPQRLALLSAVLEKRLGVNLWDQDIYLNVVGDWAENPPPICYRCRNPSSLFNKLPVHCCLARLDGEIRPPCSLSFA
jgi:hypothetical protein